MSKYTVTLPTGKVVKFEAPSGLNDMQAVQQAQMLASQQQGSELAQAAYDYDASDVTLGERLGDILPGLGRGATNLASDAVLGLGTMLNEETEQGFRDSVVSGRDYITQDLLRTEPGMEGDFQNTVTEGIGSLIPLLATAGFSGPAGLALAGGFSTSAGVGDASERARGANATEDQRNKALLGGGAAGATQVLPIAKMIGVFGPKVVKGAVDRVKNAAATGGMEGAQEMAYELAQNLTSQAAYNSKVGTLENVGEAGVGGLTVGAIVQGLIDALPGRGRSADANPVEDETPTRAPFVGPPTAEEAGIFGPQMPSGMNMEEQGDFFGVDLNEEEMGRAMADLDAYLEEADLINENVDDERAANEEGNEFQFDIFQQLEPEETSRPQQLSGLLERDPIEGEIVRPQPERLTGPNVDSSIIEEAQRRQREAVEQEALNDNAFRDNRRRESSDLEMMVSSLSDEQLERLAMSLTGSADGQNDLFPRELLDAKRDPQQDNTTLANSGVQAVLGFDNQTMEEADRVNELQGQQGKQREMFGPKGGILRQAKDKPAGPNGPFNVPPQTTPQDKAQRDLFPKELARAERKAQPEQGALFNRQGRPTLAAAVDRTSPKQQGRFQKESPSVPPIQITDALLDAMKIPKAAPIRRRIRGRNLADGREYARVTQDLKDFANAQGPRSPARAGIQRFLQGVDPDQLSIQAEIAKKKAKDERKPATPKKPEDAVDDNGTGKADTGRVRGSTGDSSGGTGRGASPDGKRSAGAPKPPKQPRVADSGSDATDAGARDDGPEVPPLKKKAPAKKKESAKPQKQASQKADEPNVKPETSKTTNSAVDKILANDKVKLATAWQKSKKEAPPESAVKQYVQNYDNDVERAVRAIAHDSVIGQSRENAAVEGNADVFKRIQGTNTKYAKKAERWLRDNSNAETVAMLDDYKSQWEAIKGAREVYDKRMAKNEQVSELANTKKESEQDKIDKAQAEKLKEVNKKLRDEKAREARARRNAIIEAEAAKKAEAEARVKARKKEEEAFDEDIDENEAVRIDQGVDEDASDFDDLMDMYLGSEVNVTNAPMHESVAELLMNGDLKGALAKLAEIEGGEVAQIAKKMSKFINQTKIEFGDLEGGYGKYNTGSDTITLDPAMGLSNHALLHEVAHALTHKALKNTNSLEANAIKKLFEELKPRLEEMGDYGSLNVDEFVAEYFGNDQFRAELRAMVDGNSNFLQKMYERVVNLIRKVLKLPQTIESGSTLDKMMDAILAPSSTSSLIQDFYYNPGAMDQINSTGKNFYEAGRAVGSGTFEWLAEQSPKAIRIMLGGLQLSAVVDAVKAHYPKTANKLMDVISEYEAKMKAITKEVGDGAVRDLEKWYKDASSEKRKRLGGVLFKGSEYEVDVRDPESKYKGEQLKRYKEVRALYDRLGTDGQLQYNKIRSNYDRLYSQLLDQLKVELKRAGASTQEVNNLFTDNAGTLLQTLAEGGGLRGYFPLRRKGRHLLAYSFTDDKGNRQDVFEMFEKKSQRDTARAWVEGNLNEVTNIRTPTKLSIADFADRPSYAFAGKVINVLKSMDNGKTDAEKQAQEDAVNEILQTIVELSPQTSVLRSMQKRKKGEDGLAIMGYDTDYVSVYRASLMSLSRRIPSLEMRSKLSTLAAEIAEEQREVTKKGDFRAERLKAMGDEMLSRIELAKNPKDQNFSNLLKSAGYLYTLGFNTSSALIDMFAIPMVIYPQLMNQHKGQKVFKAINDAMSVYMKTGNRVKYESFTSKGLTDEQLKELGIERDTYDEAAFKSLANIDFNDPNLDPSLKPLKELVDAMYEKGQIHMFTLHADGDMVNENANVAKFNNTMGFMMQMSERARREVTMIAKYNLELEKLKKEKGSKRTDAEMRKMAAEAALETNQLLNGAMSVLSNTRYGQSPILSIPYMFKSYGARMLYLQFKMAKQLVDAAKAGDKEATLDAVKHIAFTYGLAAMFTGARGLPMMGVVALLYNMFFGDDDDFDSMMRRGIGTLGTEGIVNRYTGLNVAQRIALTDLMFRSNPNNENKTPTEILATTLLGPVGGTADRLYRAAEYFGKGNFERGTENLLPAAFSNVLKAGRYATDGARTTKGDVIADDFGFGSIVGQAIGFSPAELARKQSFITYSKYRENLAQEERGNLLDQAYVAWRFGDYEEYSEILEDIRDFNEEVDNVHVIDLGKNGTLDRSFRSRQAGQKDRVLGIRFKDAEKRRAEAEELGMFD